MISNAWKVIEDLKNIKYQKPLIHNITNYVVMNNTANALLAIGASPVMAHAVEEVEDMVKIAAALAINIGTLSKPWIEAMRIAMNAAAKKNIPIIFDPVGIGATNYRNQTCAELLNLVTPTIIRGNPSEIITLAKILSPEKIETKNVNKELKENQSKGVDSTEASDKAIDAAVAISQALGCVVSVSGEVDFIVQDTDINKVGNGNHLMPLVTGLGCTATSLTAAFAAVNESPFIAATNAMVVMGIAGEVAAEESIGPGTLQTEFIDALYLLDEEQIVSRIKLTDRET